MAERKFNWSLVFVIGLGFFTTGISWSLYNTFLGPYIQDFIGVYSFLIPIPIVIGFVLILDNITAFILQPIIGGKSDKTRTRWGRRMPYLMVGIPLAAVFFIFIPIAGAIQFVWGFWVLVGVIAIFNVTMAFYRSPTVALMPDFTPSEHRTKANGVINLMGGIGSILAFAVGTTLYRVPGYIAWIPIGPLIAFGSVSVIMIICLLIMMWRLQEPPVPEDVEERKDLGITPAVKEVFRSKDRTGISILFAIFSWFLAYQALEAFFTLYGENVLLIDRASAGFMLTAFALSFVLFAIPAGFIANVISRKKAIMIGIVGFAVCIGLIPFIPLAAPTMGYLLTMALLLIAGIFWAMINVQSIVLVWEIGKHRMGSFTGIYYLFSTLAAMVGPVLCGAIIWYGGVLIGQPLGNYVLMWPFSVMVLIIAFLFMLGVKSGEAGEEKAAVTNA
ncbi:MAG: MFS transporter [Promethearchaeota archaeon]